jgi:3-hydroxyisobutyrate dehydrogenase-like beta-hydroxyacid dehydrogenase
MQESFNFKISSPMTPPSIGFIGFGEAAFHIASGLRSAGISKITAYDINDSAPVLGQKIQQHARDSSTPLASSASELAAAADIVFSAVTASSALAAAEQTLPFLRPGHIFVDINSISPGLKQEINALVRASGAGFVEAAVMAPVPPYGHRVPMLLGGTAARRLADSLIPFGMRLEVVSEDVGMAAAVKMCRSIVVKGLEALLFECVMGASKYGAEERVFGSLQESFPGLDWKKLADYMVSRVVLHGERRAREMEEVAKTLRSTGVEPTMAEATARFQDWAAQMDFKTQFGPDGPKTYREVLKFITNKTKG